jgi:16S rRNA processing protein RimM
MPVCLRPTGFFSMKKEALIHVGFIMRPHGLKGEVTARLTPECPDLRDVEHLVVEMPNGVQKHFFLESVNGQGLKTYLKFEGTNTVDDAMSLQKCKLMLPKSQRPRQARGEFYDDEVAGFTVVDANHGRLGSLREIIRTDAVRMLSVSYQGRELLIPVNDHFVSGINRRKKEMAVTLPEGYLEIL